MEDSPPKDDAQRDENDAERNEGRQTKGTSSFQTFIHIVKVNVGIGILALPQAISNIGLLTGLFGIVILSAFAVYCMHLLVTYSKILLTKVNDEELNMGIAEGSGSKMKVQPSVQKVIRKDSKSVKQYEPPKKTLSLDYQTTVEKAFQFGPKELKKFAPVMRYLVTTLLVLTQFGFACSYFLFTAENLHTVTRNLNGTDLSVSDFLLIEWPVMIALNLIPNLRMLAVISAISIALQVVSLGMLCSFFFTGGFQHDIHHYLNPAVERWPLYFGTVMFSFEAITAILPLESDMKNKKRLRGFFGVLNVGMFVVIFTYLFIGGSGYAKYGDKAKSSVTLNIPEGNFSEIIRLMFALAIFLSYPIQMYVPLSFILPYLKRKFVREEWPSWVKFGLEVVFRAIMVSITFCFALAVPMLDLVISLVGAFTGTALALIIPPVIELVCVWDLKEFNHRTTVILSDIIIFVLGLFGMVVGAAMTIKAMIERSQ